MRIVLCKLLNGMGKEEVLVISCTDYSILLRYIPFPSPLLLPRRLDSLTHNSPCCWYQKLASTTPPRGFYTGWRKLLHCLFWAKLQKRRLNFARPYFIENYVTSDDTTTLIIIIIHHSIIIIEFEQMNPRYIYTIWFRRSLIVGDGTYVCW